MPAPSGRVAVAAPARPAESLSVVMSIDVEEHDRIEAAAGLDVPATLKVEYATRMEECTRWLLDQLATKEIKATFFVLGKLARTHPSLVRAIHAAGHEVASHSWEHRRVHTFTRAGFREDARKAKDALEQVIGARVVGYRAPTFSVVRETAWALDVLVELGFVYDSSIFPIAHDRYGIPAAPRAPFLAQGEQHQILELPLATLRLCGMNWPIGGGGYFRLLPLWVVEYGLRRTAEQCRPAVAMLYAHPWEFDPAQPGLPLRWLRRWRTYVGIEKARKKLARLLGWRWNFTRAQDVAARCAHVCQGLVHFRLTPDHFARVHT